ncbi:hypothetical protein RHGRI_025783 [Rhododendron griersonianum]|uniref:non-specific serine/threonine protein kinase n=1 Tax=Rhododendron griersonianum TaxID=479676 RepID=A0AAV6IQI1_9ERIC|nr:hypothetical protein RHGRI_025783 [Rhododendron griersonianum]
MEQTLQAILIATGALVMVIMLFAVAAAAYAAGRKNRGEIPITRPPAATGLSSTFDPKQVSMAELEKATAAAASVWSTRPTSPTPASVPSLSKSSARMPSMASARSDRVLVYEYVPNGSLDKWLLLDTPSETPKTPRLRLTPSWETRINVVKTLRSRLPLSWETRIKIVRGVASGLAYMHNLKTSIIHRNIKASKVLLANDFEPHIADFGLARIIEGSLSHVSTEVAGTMGYMAPEYVKGAIMATPMGDV